MVTTFLRDNVRFLCVSEENHFWDTVVNYNMVVMTLTESECHQAVLTFPFVCIQCSQRRDLMGYCQQQIGYCCQLQGQQYMIHHLKTSCNNVRRLGYQPHLQGPLFDRKELLEVIFGVSL